MNRINFKDLTRNDVITAINYFDEKKPDYRKPRNTFLKYNGKLYPGKFIRKLTYELKNKTQLTSEDLGGGKETVRFFERLGFEIDYSPKHVNTHPKKKTKSKKEDLIIGLYNQMDINKNPNSFNQMKNIIKNSDIDLLAFPEFCYVPFGDGFDIDFTNKEDRDELIKEVLNLSEELGTAIVINNGDNNEAIVSIYANSKADEDNRIRIHFKHAYTGKSYFDLEGDEPYYSDQYKPVLLKGWKIGFSICFDMLLPLLDKIKRKDGAEIIINSTGGNVVRSKWSNNLRTRAIENQLYYFTTMGEGRQAKTVITGSSPEGKEVISEEIGDEISGSIRRFIVKKEGTKTQEFSDPIRQTPNKTPNFSFNLDEIDQLEPDYKQIEEDIFIKENGNTNLIFILIDKDNIFDPVFILRKMLSPKLESILNKKFVLINKRDDFDEVFYLNQLLPVLRTRATENFSAVLFISPELKQGFQATLNKYSQVIPIEDNRIDLDLNRMGGPQTFWNHHGKSGKKWFKSFKNSLALFENNK